MNERIVVNLMIEDYIEVAIDPKNLQTMMENAVNDTVCPSEEWFRVDVSNQTFNGHDAVVFTIYMHCMTLPFHPMYSYVLGIVEGFLRGQRFLEYTVETYL